MVVAVFGGGGVEALFFTGVSTAWGLVGASGDGFFSGGAVVGVGGESASTLFPAVGSAGLLRKFFDTDSCSTALGGSGHWSSDTRGLLAVQLPEP